MSPTVPLHGASAVSPSLVALVAVATAGTGVLLGLAVGAFLRRGTRSYLLLVFALAALFGRSVVAVFTVTGLLSAGDHHVLEHGFDVLVVALVIGAVYHARTAPEEVQSQP